MGNLRNQDEGSAYPPRDLPRIGENTSVHRTRQRSTGWQRSWYVHGKKDSSSRREARCAIDSVLGVGTTVTIRDAAESGCDEKIKSYSTACIHSIPQKFCGQHSIEHVAVTNVLRRMHFKKPSSLIGFFRQFCGNRRLKPPVTTLSDRVFHVLFVHSTFFLGIAFFRRVFRPSDFLFGGDACGFAQIAFFDTGFMASGSSSSSVRSLI